MGTGKVVFFNFLASFWSKGSITLCRLIQVPLFLNFYDAVEYGHWIVISSLPAWLSLSNVGLGSVASNEISIAAGQQDWKKASEIYSTALLLTWIVGVLGSIGVVFFVLLLPTDTLLSIPSSRHLEVSWAVLWLSLSVFGSFSIGIFGAKYRAARKAHKATFIASFRPWVELVFIFLTLVYHPTFDYLAFSSSLAVLFFLIYFSWSCNNVLKEVRFRISLFSFTHLKYLFRKGSAFQAFPLGDAFIFQGSILVVQFALGPASVVLFSTARTLVRAVNQLMELINQTVWPELSLLFGIKDFVKAARLHRLSIVTSFFLAVLGVIALMLIGQPLYELWTGKALVLDERLLFVFLLPIPFNAFWFTSSVVHAASNQHEGLAIRYLVACFFSVVVCWILSREVGLWGAAFSTIIVDLALIPYVFRKSMSLTQDNMKYFFPNIRKDISEVNEIIKSQLRKADSLG